MIFVRILIIASAAFGFRPVLPVRTTPRSLTQRHVSVQVEDGFWAQLTFLCWVHAGTFPTLLGLNVKTVKTVSGLRFVPATGGSLENQPWYLYNATIVKSEVETVLRSMRGQYEGLYDAMYPSGKEIAFISGSQTSTDGRDGYVARRAMFDNAANFGGVSPVAMEAVFDTFSNGGGMAAVA